MGGAGISPRAVSLHDRLLALNKDVTRPERADAVEIAEQKMLQWRAELEQWRHLSASTAFDPS
jgi:hypothetical protein